MPQSHSRPDAQGRTLSRARRRRLLRSQSSRRMTSAEMRVHAHGDPAKRVDTFTPDHLPHVGEDLYRIVQREADSAAQAQIIASLKLIVIRPIRLRDLASRAV